MLEDFSAWVEIEHWTLHLFTLPTKPAVEFTCQAAGWPYNKLAFIAFSLIYLNTHFSVAKDVFRVA